MAPHYWHLLASEQTDLLFLPPFNRDFARLQEWCNRWCLMLNPNKTKALVISTARTVSPPHVDLVLSGVYIRSSPNLDILGVKFDSKLTFKDHVRGIVSRVSRRIGILRLVKHICGHLCFTSLLFCICCPNPWVCSPVWGSAAECHLQLLERQVFRWPGCVPSRVSCSVIDVVWLGLGCCTRLIRTLITICSASFHHLLQLEFDKPELRAQLIYWSFKYQGVERPNLLGLSCRLRFDWGIILPSLRLTLECWMGSRVQSTFDCFPELCFFQFSVAQVLWGCECNL